MKPHYAFSVRKQDKFQTCDNTKCVK